jgi:hypothetical protein
MAARALASAQHCFCHSSSNYTARDKRACTDAHLRLLAGMRFHALNAKTRFSSPLDHLLLSSMRNRTDSVVVDFDVDETDVDGRVGGTISSSART